MAACANSHHFLQGKTSQLNSSMGNFAGRGRGVHACMCMCVCVCVCVGVLDEEGSKMFVNRAC